MEKIKKINENEIKVDGCVYRKVEESKPEFKAGDWAKINGYLYRILRINNERYYIEYGFGTNSPYEGFAGFTLEKLLEEGKPTRDEIESHLIKIADEKYPRGVKMKCLCYPERGVFKLNNNGNSYRYWENQDKLVIMNNVTNISYIPNVYCEGKWAEIIPDKKKLPKTLEAAAAFLADFNASGKGIHRFIADYE